MAAAEERKIDETPHRKGQHWTEKEDKLLSWGYAQIDLKRLSIKLGRTIWACRHRAKILKLQRPGQGTMSLQFVARELGYESQTIKLVAKKIGIPLNLVPMQWSHGRRSKNRQYAISEDDVELIKKYLDEVGWKQRPTVDSNKIWGANGRPDACLKCGKTEKDHKTRGLCSTCYEYEKRYKRLDDYPLIRKIKKGRT